MRASLLFLFAGIGSAGEMDSTRGALLFESQRCVQCHSLNGRGGRIAADLGHAIDRAYSPAALAAAMWNHAPAMWSAMDKAGTARPELDEQAAGDLFAFFYAARLFDRPGDSARGKTVFTERGCSGCHGVGAAAASKALPPDEWTSVADSVDFAAAMWNHAPQMQAEVSRRRKSWPKVTGQNLTDLLVYLRNSPAQRDRPSRFQISSGGEGEKIFESKGCTRCHGPGKIQLGERLRGLTLTGISAQMWDHAPLMKTDPVHLEPSEMRALLGYLWTRPFLEERGNAAAGRRVFASKRCAACHEDAASGAPQIVPASTVTGITMVSVLWKHGPRMLEAMQTKNIPWPRFGSEDMTNLITYLNTQNKPGDRK